MQKFRNSPCVKAAAHTALGNIQMRFGDGVTEDAQLAYHGVAHTCGVLARSMVLAHAMGLSPSEIDLVGIAASFHDTVQEWEEYHRPDGALVRRRFVGRNEEASAAEAVLWMRESGAYDDRAYQLVTDAILATVPGWDPVLRTVIQPNLHVESHPVIRAVALADLGTAGMEGERFTEDADPLFREECLDIARALRTATMRSELDEEQQEAFRQRMVAWRELQMHFACGRKQLLEVELGDLSATSKERVRSLFGGFDAAIAASSRIVEERRALPFWTLAERMGYVIPSA